MEPPRAVPLSLRPTRSLGCSGSPFPLGGLGPQADPAGPGLWLQSSSLSSLVSACCVPVRTQAPRLQTWGGRQTLLVRGSLLPSAQVCQPAAAGPPYASASRGLWGTPPPRAAYLPLPGSFSPQWAGTPAGAARSCPVTPGPWRLRPRLRPRTECSPRPGGGAWRRLASLPPRAEHSPDHGGPAVLTPIKAIPASKKRLLL